MFIHTELMGNVFDCLESLNLTELVSLIRDTSLMDTLNRTDTSFTFFAPSNEAIEEAEATNPIGGDAVDVFSTHIVEKIVPESRLRHGVVLTPLMDETLLHVTDVYEYGGWGYFRWRASEVSLSLPYCTVKSSYALLVLCIIVGFIIQLWTCSIENV